MIKQSTYSVVSTLLGKCCVALFIFLFLNISVFNLYQFDTNAMVELFEEEGDKESEEELNVISYQKLHDSWTLVIDFQNFIQNKNIVLDCHVEVFTPPPEFS